MMVVLQSKISYIFVFAMKYLDYIQTCGFFFEWKKLPQYGFFFETPPDPYPPHRGVGSQGAFFSSREGGRLGLGWTPLSPSLSKSLTPVACPNR